ncbi:hypothetical protein DFA_00465 [Cavenderia fasciculata]|uniref:Uncharacterized protein n=1 Tax=Cavenderia fasciculata TaxID=261658 RepID=F4PS06_CACFS|nr:uncharacterized protein DFA_00465 [Cavenderia fasciculata]EGG20604.1 hypothetical protein DFA_00465 [Cavenderia fasciculata]|eukprot:XP_004358454.1 hypothetical protein DFA_00465 [Cavenderia fasciculata]
MDENEPPESFIQVIVQLSKERIETEYKNNNNKNNNNKTIEVEEKSRAQQTYDGYLDDDRHKTILWLYYLVLHCHLPTINKQSIYMLGNEIIRDRDDYYLPIERFSLTDLFKLVVEDKDNDNDNGNDDNINHLIHLLFTFNGVPKYRYKQSCDALHFGSNQSTETMLRFFERHGPVIPPLYDYTIFSLLGRYLCDSSNVEIQHRAINIINRIATVQMGQFEVVFLKTLDRAGFGQQRDRTLVLEIDNTIIQILVDGVLKTSLFGHHKIALSIIKYLNPNKYQNLSNRVLKEILLILPTMNETKKSTCFIRFFFGIGRIVGMKQFNRYLLELMILSKSANMTSNTFHVLCRKLMKLDPSHISLYYPIIIKPFFYERVDSKMATKLSVLAYSLSPYLHGLTDRLCKELERSHHQESGIKSALFGIFQAQVSKHDHQPQPLFARFSKILLDQCLELQTTWDISNNLDRVQKMIDCIKQEKSPIYKSTSQQLIEYFEKIDSRMYNSLKRNAIGDGVEEERQPEETIHGDWISSIIQIRTLIADVMNEVDFKLLLDNSKYPPSHQVNYGYSFWKIIIHAFNIASIDKTFQPTLDQIYQFINHHLSTPPPPNVDNRVDNVTLALFLKSTLKQDGIHDKRFKVSIFPPNLLSELNQHCPLFLFKTN